MYWILFALLAPLLWGITNIFDKYLLEKYIPNIFVYLFFTGAINLIVLVGIPIWGFQVPSLTVIAFALVAGALFNYQMLPYFKSLQIADASRVIPLYQFTPLFTFIFSFLFLHEHLEIRTFIAFTCLVVGGFAISLEKIEGVFKISKALFYMLGACFLCSLYLILSRYVYLHTSFYVGFTWESIGGFLSILPLLLSEKTRKDVFGVFTKTTTLTKSLLLLNEFINLGAIVFIQLALSTGTASLVSALGGIQPLYVLIMTVVLSIWFSHILKEETTVSVILHKSFAIILIVVGVLLVTL